MLGRMFDGIEYRGDSQETVEELAAYAGVPVYNGLTDDWHPTQMLADVLTMTEHSDKPLERDRLRLPRRRPLQHGQLLPVTGALLGMDVRIVAPRGLLARRGRSSTAARELAETSGARITLTEDVAEGVRGRRLRRHRRLGLHGGAQGGLGRADRGPRARTP